MIRCRIQVRKAEEHISPNVVMEKLKIRILDEITQGIIDLHLGTSDNIKENWRVHWLICIDQNNKDKHTHLNNN